jgi:molybdopterin converting factor small subunit
MQIYFYGRVAEKLGPSLELETGGELSIAELRERLAAAYPDSADALGKRVRACVADTIVADCHVVGPGETVEFFPPVSGG